MRGIKWQKAFGAAGRETNLWASSAYENKDGTFTILGNLQNRYNETDYGYPIFVELQLSNTGDLVKSYLITDDTSESVFNGGRVSIKRTADDGYVTVADYAVSGISWTGVVTKLDSSGKVEWGHYICPMDASQNTKVKIADLKVLEVPDGFVAAGNAYINAVQKLFVYKVDLQGNLLWNKLISGITLNNEVHFDNLYLTQDNNILVSVMNGYSTVDFTLVNMTNSGNVNWVESYRSKLGFDRGYGGSVYLHRLINTTDHTLVGVTSNFITKFAQDGSIAFKDDRFMSQDRSGWKLEDGNAERIQAGYWYKFTPSSEFSIIGKDVTYSVPGSAKDTDAISAPGPAAGGGAGQSVPAGTNPSAQTLGAGTSFTDLPSSHWAYADVNFMVAKGVFNGYPDGTFKPNNPITRNVFAKILVLALDLQLTHSGTPTFTDVGSKHWALPYVETAKPYLTGYYNSKTKQYTFKPTQSALREDVAVAMVKALQLENSEVDMTVLDQFTDKDQISPNLRKLIAIAVDKGLMKGSGGSFQPQATLTRAQACVLLKRVADQQAGSEEKVTF